MKGPALKGFRPLASDGNTVEEAASNRQSWGPAAGAGLGREEDIHAHEIVRMCRRSRPHIAASRLREGWRSGEAASIRVEVSRRAAAPAHPASGNDPVADGASRRSTPEGRSVARA